MKLLRLLLLASIGVMLAGPIFAAEPARESCPYAKEWRPSKEELEQILSKHRQWVERSREDRFPAEEGRANLCNAYLYRAELNGAILEKADLSGAQLIAAKLNKANVVGALLSGATAQHAEFNNADLSGANLDAANLGFVELNDANLRTASLKNAFLWLPDLRSELLSFPAGKHDDIVDALGLIGQLLDTIAKGAKPEPPPEKTTSSGYQPYEWPSRENEWLTY